jgi:uncharacterized protein
MVPQFRNELWDFDADGFMTRREASFNDVPIAEADRRIFGARPGAERGQSFPPSLIKRGSGNHWAR